MCCVICCANLTSLSLLLRISTLSLYMRAYNYFSVENSKFTRKHRKRMQCWGCINVFLSLCGANTWDLRLVIKYACTTTLPPHPERSEGNKRLSFFHVWHRPYITMLKSKSKVSVCALVIFQEDQCSQSQYTHYIVHYMYIINILVVVSFYRLRPSPPLVEWKWIVKFVQSRRLGKYILF